MGHNIDLCWLLGLPQQVKCERCRRKINSGFDEYDVDCGNPEADENGVMTLSVYCNECEHDFDVFVQAKIKRKNGKYL